MAEWKFGFAMNKPHLILGLILAIGLWHIGEQMGQLADNWPIFRLWLQPDAQYRLALAELPYDLLQEVNQLLPSEAGLLLVTNGQDVRHLEYTTFHRALYFLAPRPVWWLSPAAPDQTWESRWWISRPVTAANIAAVAQAKGLSCVLLVEQAVAGLTGQAVATFGNSQLWQVGDGPCVAQGLAFARPVFGWRQPFGLMVGLIGVVLSGRVVLWLIGYSATAGEGLALAWLLGCGFLSLAMWWLAGLGLSLDQQRMVLAVLALFGLRAGWKWRPKWPKLSAISWFLLLFLIFQLLYVGLMVVGRPFIVWDSWVNWGMKATIIFRQNGITPTLYADASRAVALLDYPLFTPLLEAWLYGWMGQADDRLVGVIFWLSYLSLFVVVYGGLRRQGSRQELALLAVSALAAIPQLTGLFAVAFNDSLLAVWVAVVGIYYLERSRPGATLLTILAIAFLPWLKREGLILAGLFWVIGTGLAMRQGAKGLAVGWGGMIALLFLSLPWYYFSGRYAIPNANFQAMTPAGFLANLYRVPTILWLLFKTLTALRFNGLWVLTPILVVAKILRRQFAAQELWLLLPAFLYLGCMVIFYIFSDFGSYQQHLLSSAFRLAGQLVPLIVLWLAANANQPQKTASKTN